MPQFLRLQRGPAEPVQAAAPPGRYDGRSGVGHRQNRPHLPAAVHSPGSPAHAAFTYPSCQVTGPNIVRLKPGYFFLKRETDLEMNLFYSSAFIQSPAVL